MNKFENRDCTEGMAEYPDKYFDLAIVDPPYGIIEKIQSGGRQKKLIKGLKSWDKAPDKKYFDELFRVSKDQIICGGNYFVLPISRGWMIWDKQCEKIPTVHNELIWSSFNKPIKMFSRCNGLDHGFLYTPIHPTQKPVELYKWLLQNYAKKEDKILDTHVGSASSLLACIEMGFEYTGFELDKDYYNAACKRIQGFNESNPDPFGLSKSMIKK